MSSSTDSEIAKEINNMKLTDSWADSVDTKEINTLEESLEDQQHDPNNPLFSEKVKFESMKLKKELLEGIYNMKYKEPSRIQAKSLPIILEKNVNLIAQSQSGTGKTACFALGMLNIIDENNKNPQALCICPTLELAQQIFEVTKGLAVATKVNILMLMKGGQYDRNIEGQILIGTPGKILDLIKRRQINTKDIKLFVLDEADAMLEEGSNQLRDQSIMIKQKLPDTCRVLLFSATFREEGDQEDVEGKEKEKQIMEFAEKIVPKPLETILIPKEQLTLKHMKQFSVTCKDEEEKIRLIKDIYETLKIGQSIIFVNTKSYADKLTELLRQAGFTISLLHGGLQVDERRKVITDFKLGHAKVLISTNVLARGLDISTVTHVINFDLPTTKDEKTGEWVADYATYLHRIGRTARFGRSGFAINLIRGKRDEYILNDIKQYFQTKIENVPLEEIDERIK
ncbi:hypothetical protein ABK040_014263 [Willaertia magna]